MTELDPQQQAAVESTARKTLVVAGAGSGKTRVLVERIAYLIEYCKASPYDIIAFSFTRKAAGELKTRLLDRLGNKANRITCGTSHSIAAEMIRRYDPQRARNTIYGPVETDMVLKDVATETGVFKKSWKPTKTVIDKAFLDYATTAARPKEGDPALDIFNAFQFRCRQNRALTYDDLLVEFHQLIPEIANYQNWRHVLVDECQDLTPLQWSIIDSLSESFKASIYAVGDMDQCQPTGTKVLLADNTEINIEDLNPDIHTLRVYDKHDALIYGGNSGGTRGNGYKFSIYSRNFIGTLYDIEAGGRKTSCTGTHRWWVKWSDKSKSKNVVYFMRKGDRYRIGWCQLFKSDGAFHLGCRCNIERADAAWILKVFDNKKDASVYESIISAQYGIPMTVFNPLPGCTHYNKEAIDQIFDALYPLEQKAIKCLSDHARNLNYPLWEKKDNSHCGTRTIFGISTYNFIPGFFMVPVRGDAFRKIKWEVAAITTRESYGEVVYSLDVEKHHTYIADGICTRNSIYQFRGAVPGYLIYHCDDFTRFLLETNYRSLPGIVAAGNNVIRHNLHRVDKISVAHRKPESLEAAANMVKVIRDIDSAGIVNMISGRTDSGEIAVLARNHYLIEKVSTLLTEVGVEHTYAGAKNNMLRELPAITLHSFLRLCCNPNDNFSFMVIRKILGISDQQYAQIRLEATQFRVGHLSAWMMMGSDYPTAEQFFFQQNNGKRAALPEVMLNLIDLAGYSTVPPSPERWGLDVGPVIDFIDAWIEENKAGANVMIQDYLDYLALFDVQDELINDEDTPMVTLSTIHAAKGLEFETVIIAGMNEGIFPGARAINDEAEMDAELNLAYVAMTRAEDQLILTVRPEVTFDKYDKQHVNPESRFVKWL